MAITQEVRLPKALAQVYCCSSVLAEVLVVVVCRSPGVGTSDMRSSRTNNSSRECGNQKGLSHERSVGSRHRLPKGWLREFESSKRPQDGPKTTPRWLNTAPSWPKMALRWPQHGPDCGAIEEPPWAQDCPTVGHRWLPAGPKMAQDGPNRAQAGCNRPQDGPKMAQDGPKRPQNLFT
jgi:hypothetical protein